MLFQLRDEDKGVPKPDKKGVIKDDERELDRLTDPEVKRVTQIATIFGQVLQVGIFKKGPEAGRLKAEQAARPAAGSGSGIPAAPKPGDKMGLNLFNLPDWLKWLALLGGIATAAYALFDTLGGVGRFLIKAAFKIGKWIDVVKDVFTSFGKYFDDIVDAFKGVKAFFKGFELSKFLDDLKARFPKTAELFGELKQKWLSAIDAVKSKWSKFLDDLFFEKLPEGVEGPRMRTKLGQALDRVKGWWSKSLDAILYEKLPDSTPDKSATRLQQAAKRISQWYNSLFIDVKAIKVDGQWVDDTQYTKLGERVAAVRDWWKNTVDRISNIGWLKKAEGVADIAGDAKKSLPAMVIDSAVELAKSLFGGIGETVKGAFKIGGEGGLIKTITEGFKNSPFLKAAMSKAKFIPVIGGFFNIGFAIARFKKGEIFKGTLELLSGLLDIAGIFTGGLGSGLSMAIDGFLLISDMQEDQAQKKAEGKKPFSGGFFSDLADGFMKYIAPILRYIPLVGSLFYFGDAYTAFKESNWGTGLLKLGQGFLSLDPSGVGSAINLGIDLISSLFTDKKEGGEEAKESKGGFFSWLGTAFSEYVKPYLRYIPFIGTIFYGAEAWDSFKAGNWGTGLLKLTQALFALDPTGIGSLINLGADFIMSFFTDKQEGGEEAKESKGGFFTWVKEKFAEHVKPHLDKLPILAPIKYGSEAWDAFKAGDWTGGFKKLGLALLNLIPGVGFVNTGIGFIMSFFDEGDKAKIEEAKSNGGFKDMMIAVFDVIGGKVKDALTAFKEYILGAVDSAVAAAKDMLSWIPGVGDNEKPTVTSDGKKIYSEKTKQNAKESGWGEDVKGYEDSEWKTKAEWDAIQKAKQTATPAATPTPTSTPAATPAAPTLTQAATPAATIAPTEMRAPATELPDRGRAAAAAAATNRAKETAPAQVQAATPAAGQTETERRAKEMGWSTVEEYRNSGWKQNPAVARGIKESKDTVLNNAKAMGWKTVEEYRNSGWKQNPAVIKGVEDAEDPVVLRNAKAMGWNTIEEYKNSGWKQNPAMLAGAAQAAAPAATISPEVQAATPAATAVPGMQAALAMPTTSGSPLFQAYQAAAPAASTTPSSPMPIGSNAMESIADFTFRKEAQLKGGKLAVYKPPAGDGGGAFEVAGITARYQPKEAAELKALVEAGRHQEAESKAKLFFAKRAEPFIKHTNRAGIQLQLTDIVHNRGEGGLRSILQRATGMASEKDYQKLIETLNTDPQALEKLHKARVSYEMEVVDRGRASRAKFRQGLMNRFNAAYTASQQIEARGSVPTAPAPAVSVPVAAAAATPAATFTPVAAASSSGPPYTEQSVMPAATPAASGQFQPQSINVPASGGAPVTTTWSGGESNFVINGANMGGLNSEFRRRLESMAAEYKAKTGKKINISGARSGYRTYEQQVAIAKTARPGYAATPGTSNHGFGFALDINTADANRADSLGLLQKYGLHRPMMSKGLFEPWHIEPVGLNKAALAQYRAKRESGKFSGDQLAFAFSGSGSSGPPYTEQSVMPTAIAAATPAAAGIMSSGSSSLGSSTDTGGSLIGAFHGGISSSLNSTTTGLQNIFSSTGGATSMSQPFTSSPSVPAVAMESSSQGLIDSVDKLAGKSEQGSNKQVSVLEEIRNGIAQLNKNIAGLSRGGGSVAQSTVLGIESGIASTRGETDKITSPGIFGGKFSFG